MSDPQSNPSRRSLLLASGAAVTAAFTGPRAAMAQRVERNSATPATTGPCSKGKL